MFAKPHSCERRRRRECWVSPLPHLAYPQASWFLLVSNPPEARHIQLPRVERIATLG